jgi:nitrite reductase (NADH) small subunit
MPLVKVASLAQLADNTVTEVMVGAEPYAICNVGGRVTALSGVCLHRGGPLGQGAIHEGRVVCPWHAWEWDCQTGSNDFDSAQKVATFPVTVQGDDVLLELP